MPIAKKRSIQNDSLFLREAYFWSIYVKNGCVDHSSCMGEDRNNDLSYGQLGHSVGISQFVVEAVEEEQNLEQLKVSYYEEIRHSEIWWAWSSLEYEDRKSVV